MYGTLKKIFAFAGSKKGLLKKSLLFAFLSGLFSAMQFAALFVVIGALVSDNRDGKFICISLGRDDTPNEGNGHNSQRKPDKHSVPVVRYQRTDHHKEGGKLHG